MNDKNIDAKTEGLLPNGIITFLISLVHNKVFPTIICVLFPLVTYPLVLSGPGGFFLKLIFVLITAPGFVLFSIYMFAWCDAAPNIYEAYKRFKKEFSSDNK